MDNQELVETTEVENFATLETVWEDVITIRNTDEIEIFGTAEQRKELFTDWALYFGEITNPDNTTLNTFFKAKYAPMGEVLNTIRPIMGKYGLAVIQAPYMINGDVCVKTVVTHKSGALMAFPTASGKPTKNDIQGFGSTTSYLRRFVVNSIAGIFGEVDDDGNSASNIEDKKAKSLAKKETSQLKTDLIETCKLKAAINRDMTISILSKYGNNDGLVANISDETEIKNAIEELNKIKEKK